MELCNEDHTRPHSNVFIQPTDIQTVFRRTLEFCWPPRARFLYSEMCKYIFDNSQLDFFYFPPHLCVQSALGSYKYNKIHNKIF